MNKLISAATAAILLLLSLVSIPQSAFAVQDNSLHNNNAYEASNDAVPCETPIIQEMGGASVKDNIIIDGITNPLYCTFNDANKAVEEVKRNASKTIHTIAQYGNISPLDLSNWKTYQELYHTLDSIRRGRL